MNFFEISQYIKRKKEEKKEFRLVGKE